MALTALKEHSQYPFEYMPLDEENGGGYLVIFPDLPGCMSDGDTIEEAVRNGYEAVEDWIAASREWGKEIPPPSVVVSTLSSLKLSLSKDQEVSISPTPVKLGKTHSELVDERLNQFLGL